MWLAKIICCLLFWMRTGIKASNKMYHSSLLVLAVVACNSCKGNQRKFVKVTKLPSAGSTATL